MSEIQTGVTSDVTIEDIVVPTDLKNIIEALIFASDEPMTPRFIRAIVDDVNKDRQPADHYIVNAEIIRKAVGDLNRGYGRMGSGFRIIEIGGGFTYATQEQFSSWVGKLAKERARRRLSPTAVETLAIIAYKQPIAKGEVEFIRGVNVDYIINALLEKDLIHITGRASTPGRPLLYGTTQKFLEHFGLNDLSDLPKPREISELINETELEVDRRILAEQQELEFKQDLEEKLEGNEGSKNKPQKTLKVKTSNEGKSENRSREETPASLEDKKIDEIHIVEGEILSESNLTTNEVSEEAGAGRVNGTPIPANGPESPAISGQDRLAADVPQNREQSPDLSAEKHGTNSERAETFPTESEPGNRMTDAPAHLTTDVQERQSTDPGNRTADLESQEGLPNENARTTSTEDAAEHLEHSTVSGTQERPLQSETAPETEKGWSKWKNKVKTFFQKLFA